jgi:hypothetical protein
MRFDKETRQRFEVRLGRGELTLNGQRTRAGAPFVVALVIFCSAHNAFAQEQSSEDLAKKLQDPVASLILIVCAAASINELEK